jgi:diguanylate cyclase (GGDEF)-like protein/PAS domain S-box-containing protein
MGVASFPEPAARALLESTSDLIGSLDADGRIEAINDRVRAFLGRTPPEVVGTAFVDWVDPAERAALGECLASVREGRRARCDVRLLGDRGERVGNATFLARPGESGTGDDRRGVLFFVADVTGDRAAQRDLLAAHQTLRRDRERLRRLAIVDGLTGLYNHRYGKEVLRNLVDQSRRYGPPLSLAMIDLDHFKQVNDEHGHLAGDQVLQGVARMIRQGVRSSDIAVRYGGEEIALLLPNTGPADAFRLAERLRARCRKLEFRFADREVRVTFSAGVATLSPTGPADATALVRKADDNLYCAKLAGRNRVVGDGCVEGEDGASCASCDADRRRLLDRFQALAHRFSLGQLGAVQSLVRSLELKSPYAAAHGLDVMRLAGAMARAVGFDSDAADRIACAGYLHDLGLIAVPENTLTRTGPLDEGEWRLIRQHPDWGRHLLRGVPMLAEERAWIAGHHERLDGSGYPRGLRGRQISLPCRILALADVVSAMRTDRPYRPALSLEDVLTHAEADAGRGFDRDLVAVLPELLAAPPREEISPFPSI